MDSMKACKTKQNGKQRPEIARGLWLIAGLICVGLGAVGMVLPILPTTPFLLAAATCFCKSSTRMYNWLLNNKWFGEYIRNYKEGRGLPMRTKITALTVLWVTIVVSNIFFLNRLLSAHLILPMQLVMVAVAIGVSIHIGGYRLLENKFQARTIRTKKLWKRCYRNLRTEFGSVILNPTFKIAS